MKEIENLAEKNNCFKEVDCESLTEEMKKIAMSMLMFIVAKRNGATKSRGMARGGHQKV